jgi:hypothetical protein
MFALFRLSISALEYKCMKLSTCVIDLLVLMFGDKQDLWQVWVLECSLIGYAMFDDSFLFFFNEAETL